MTARDEARRGARPTRRLAILACMDARLDPVALLGLSLGEAHVLRNAGGIATDDVVRSLAVSQRRLGTAEVVVIQHTGCGMEGLDEGALLEELAAAGGVAPRFPLGAFGDVEASVRATAAAIRANPYLTQTRVRGYVYDVTSRRLEPVALP